ncbi:MAG: hypothetical protein HXK70_03075 [Clostridiales bacterium]|nr:hypothetical protein [Clostridiales bacterium]
MKSKVILSRGNEKVVIEKGSDIIDLIKNLSENQGGESFEISKLVEERVENKIKEYKYDEINGLMILKDYQDKIFYFKEDILEQLSKVYDINTLRLRENIYSGKEDAIIINGIEYIIEYAIIDNKVLNRDNFVKISNYIIWERLNGRIPKFRAIIMKEISTNISFVLETELDAIFNKEKLQLIIKYNNQFNMMLTVKNPPINAENNLIFHLGILIIKYLKYNNFIFPNYILKS